MQEFCYEETWYFRVCDVVHSKCSNWCILFKEVAQQFGSLFSMLRAVQEAMCQISRYTTSITNWVGVIGLEVFLYTYSSLVKANP